MADGSGKGGAGRAFRAVSFCSFSGAACWRRVEGETGQASQGWRSAEEFTSLSPALAPASAFVVCLVDDDEVLGDSACKKAVTAAYPPLPEHALINPLSQSAPRFKMIKDQPC